jgi:hypothetical protein
MQIKLLSQEKVQEVRGSGLLGASDLKKINVII